MALSNSGFLFENLQITNCIITNTVNIPGIINGLFRNNITLAAVTLSNTYITNNYLGNFSFSLTFVNCTVKYNISPNNNLPAGNGNQVNVPMTNVFTSTGSSDARYQLKAGSPAIAAGEPINGVTPDIGPFGTPDPYRLSGIPPIPTIYALSVPTSVPSSATTMTITVSTRSNN
jgi:hypothetical protein